MHPHDSPSLEEALASLPARCPTKREEEIVTLDRALGRVAAREVTARKSLPPFDNSAMDGFAFRHEEGGKVLCIAATIYAGDRPRP